MAARVSLRQDLDAFVAATYARPAVLRLRDAAADNVRRQAPDAKSWLSSRDERVRPSHMKADGQEIPDNLRYRLDRADGAGVELAREPRDPHLHVANSANCRCASVPVAGAIARTVETGPVEVKGPRVTAEVSATFARLVESEYPSEGDGGGGWFRQALRNTADASRARVGRV